MVEHAELDLHINDPEFAEMAARALLRLLGNRSPREGEAPAEPA